MCGWLLVVVAALPGSPATAEIIMPLKPFRTDITPTIDGVLDDPVWRQAPAETGFKTWRPDFSKDMHEKTIIHPEIENFC